MPTARAGGADGAAGGDAGERSAALDLVNALGVIVLAHVIDAHWRPTAARVVVAAVVFAALLLKRDLLRARWPWLLVTGALGWVLLEIPYRLGNHHYVLCYLGLAMALFNGRDDRSLLEDSAFVLRWSVVAIMSIAVVQRLLSPTFLDGSYLGIMILRGEFFRLVYLLCEPCAELAGIDLSLMAKLGAQDPNGGASVVLREPFEGFALAARAFAVLILAVELWIAAAFAFFRRPWVRHTALLPFVVALGFTRSEFVFASLLALVGLGTCEPRMTRLRWLYKATVAVLTACVFLTPVETGL